MDNKETKVAKSGITQIRVSFNKDQLKMLDMVLLESNKPLDNQNRGNLIIELIEKNYEVFLRELSKKYTQVE